MVRRDFIKTSLVAAGSWLIGTRGRGQPQRDFTASPRRNTAYNFISAPSLDRFEAEVGASPIDQLQFAADQGFAAVEDTAMAARPIALQEKMATVMSRLGLTMGVFSASGNERSVTFASSDASVREKLLSDLRSAIAVAKRVNAKWASVAPGAYATHLGWEVQNANVIDNFRRCAELCEPAGLVMVMEPLRSRTDSPRAFVSSAPQAHAICRAVNSPSCKMLFELDRAQIQFENFIPSIDFAWSETAYYRLGQAAERKREGAGELDSRTIFQHLHQKGYRGMVGVADWDFIPAALGA